jgi:uncharacterized protein
LEADRLKRAALFRKTASEAFRAAGYEVQTTRLAAPPFPTLLSPAAGQDELVRLAIELEAASTETGYAFLSLGPASPGDISHYAMIPDAIANTQNAFFSGALTDAGGRVSLPAVRACAQDIHRLALVSPDGFANLRFAALANVPPGTPFFPAAYHLPSQKEARYLDFMAFAIATEAADLAVQAFSGSQSLAQARQRLVASLEEHAARLERVSDELARQFGFGFNGLDFSLAPYPQAARSLGEALERMGVPRLGQHGSLAAAAVLAESIDRARFARVGFSGLMLPVLEDAILARRAGEGSLTVKDLLLYSAVCGTGLDTVPLPGDVTVEALQAVLLDLAVLSTRLSKPLTARLMPVPGKVAGDPTGFEFEYFANSRVMALEAQPLNGVLAGDESFGLVTRRG